MKKTIYMAQQRPYTIPKVKIIELSSAPVLQATSWPSSGSAIPPVDDSDDGIYGD